VNYLTDSVSSLFVTFQCFPSDTPILMHLSAVPNHTKHNLRKIIFIPSCCIFRPITLTSIRQAQNTST